MKAPDHSLRGIALRVLSGLMFALMAVFVKLASGKVPLGEIVFFRSGFALVPLVLFLIWRREFPQALVTTRPGGHALRSLLGAAAMFTSFATLARLPVAESTLIGYLSPILTAIIAILLLGERLTIFRLGGLILGLIGIAVLVQPDLGFDGTAERSIGLVLGLITALLTALALTVTRHLAKSENPGTIAFWFATTCAMAGLITIVSGDWILPPFPVLALLIAAGLFGGLAHIAMTLAFTYADASRLAPFEYAALIWAGLADFFVFGLLPEPSFVPALVLVLAGSGLALLESSYNKRFVA